MSQASGRATKNCSEHTVENCENGSLQPLFCSRHDALLTWTADPWSYAGPRKACVAFEVWFVCARCETTALMNAQPCTVILMDAFRQAPGGIADVHRPT